MNFFIIYQQRNVKSSANNCQWLVLHIGPSFTYTDFLKLMTKRDKTECKPFEERYTKLPITQFKIGVA